MRHLLGKCGDGHNGSDFIPSDQLSPEIATAPFWFSHQNDQSHRPSTQQARTRLPNHQKNPFYMRDKIRSEDGCLREDRFGGKSGVSRSA